MHAHSMHSNPCAVTRQLRYSNYCNYLEMRYVNQAFESFLPRTILSATSPQRFLRHTHATLASLNGQVVVFLINPAMPSRSI